MPTAAIKNKNEKAPAELICESCGASFKCGAQTGECWCFAVNLPAETLTNLRDNFKNCLCRNCLRRQVKRETSEQKSCGANENN